MRDYLISVARHAAGAVSGAVAVFLASQGIEGAVDPDVVAGIGDAVQAIIVAAGFIAYAMVEKALKPLVRRVLGSEGI